MSDVNKESVNKIQSRIQDLRMALLALSALIESGSKDLSLDEEQCCGLGRLIQILSRDILGIEKKITKEIMSE